LVSRPKRGGGATTSGGLPAVVVLLFFVQRGFEGVFVPKRRGSTLGSTRAEADGALGQRAAAHHGTAQIFLFFGGDGTLRGDLWIAALAATAHGLVGPVFEVLARLSVCVGDESAPRLDSFWAIFTIEAH